MIQLKKLIVLQFTYAFLGIAFNGVSYYMIIKNYGALTPTDPLKGVLAMFIYVLFLTTGYFKKIIWYKVLMTISVLIFGYNGIITHLVTINQEPDLYYSLCTMLIAVGINLFGVGLNLVAVFKTFKN